jgi:hypothetical protein
VSKIFRADFLTPAGVKYAEVTDFSEMACVIGVNRPGLLTLRLPGSHSAIAGLSRDSQIELWWKDMAMGVGWHRHFGGFYRKQKQPWQERGRQFNLAAVGYLNKLQKRIVAFPTGMDSRSSFSSVSAKRIALTLVEYNAGASATTGNSRLRAGTLTGITTDTMGDAGTVMDFRCFGKDLLKMLQELADSGGGDFDLVKTGPNTFVFTWYDGQLGTDRSTSVVFSIERGNMGDPVYELDQVNEPTVAIVGGPEDGANRKFTTATGANYAADNDCEIFVNASGEKLDAGRTAAGNKALKAGEARASFSFDVLQTPMCAFGVHYFLGDLATSINPFDGNAVVQQVDEVAFSLSQTNFDARTNVKLVSV